MSGWSRTGCPSSISGWGLPSQWLVVHLLGPGGQGHVIVLCCGSPELSPAWAVLELGDLLPQVYWLDVGMAGGLRPSDLAEFSRVYVRFCERLVLRRAS